MAVVATNSDLIHDYLDSTSTPPDPQLARGHTVTATGTVANAAADSSGSTYHLADLPSDCILQPGTSFDVQNDGFAQIDIGTKSDKTALVNQLKTAGNTITPIVVGDANHGKYLWQVLGIAADPGGMIGIYKHAAAGAAGAGSMPFVFSYLTA